MKTITTILFVALLILSSGCSKKRGSLAEQTKEHEETAQKAAEDTESTNGLSVTVRLVAKTYWPGESPQFELSLANTSKDSLHIIKQAKLSRHQRLWFHVTDANGKRVPGGPPQIDPPTIPTPEEIKADSFELLPKESVQWQFDSLTHLPVPGEYVIHVQYLEVKHSFKLKIPVTATAIPKQTIKFQHEETLDKSYGNFAGEHWQILKVNDGSDHWAVLRLWQDDIKGIQECYRLFKVSQDARMAVKLVQDPNRKGSVFGVRFHITNTTEDQAVTYIVSWHGEVSEQE